MKNDAHQASDWLKRNVSILDDAESLKLDTYPRELVEGELQRSVQLEVIEGLVLPVASRGDAAISKLVWISKRSHKSRRDFRRIWEVCSDQEQARILESANSMRLIELLKETIDEPDEIAP